MMVETENKVEYKIIGVVDSVQVPNWARKEPKWKPLIDAIQALNPKQSLTVSFDSLTSARRVCNTIRDTVNRNLGKAAIRTRVVEQEDGSTTAYFTRLVDDDIVTEPKRR